MEESTFRHFGQPPTKSCAVHYIIYTVEQHRWRFEAGRYKPLNDRIYDGGQSLESEHSGDSPAEAFGLSTGTAVAGVLFTGISMAYLLEIYHDDYLRDMIYLRQQHGDAEMRGTIHLFERGWHIRTGDDCLVASFESLQTRLYNTEDCLAFIALQRTQRLP